MNESFANQSTESSIAEGDEPDPKASSSEVAADTAEPYDPRQDSQAASPADR